MAGDLRPVRIAAIDVGTNTVLLLVAEIAPDGSIEPIAEAQETPRLGRDVDRSGRIAPGAFGRLAGIIERYASIARAHGADRIAACGTSALRGAVNGPELVAHVMDACGIGIEVIDGATEAALSWRGAVTGPIAAAPDPLVLDIGGGSTEFCYAARGATNGGRRPISLSLDIGSVRLTERCFRTLPPGTAAIEAARTLLVEELAQVRNPGFSEYTLVAVAGTATTLAGLHLGLREYDRIRIDGCAMPAAAVHAAAARLLLMDAASIRSLSGMTAGREDILPAGALILSTIVDHFGFREIRVSARGLRYGIALREWERTGGGRPS